MENAYIIEGGIPLKGTVKLSGAKNVATKVIIASLLLKKAVTLSNVPHIVDIEELLHLIQLLGARAEFIADNTVVVDSATIKSDTIDLLHASKMRVSFMLFAPLLYIYGRATIPNPGGCRLGARPIDRQVDMMKAFGIDITYDSSTGYYTAQLLKDRIKGCRYQFTKKTHTGTELAIMLGAIANGETIIENAAQEPEIDDLIVFLKSCRAEIMRKNGTIIIKGVSALQVPEEIFTIQSDRNEAPTYAAFAIATHGDVTIEGVTTGDISFFIEKVIEAGGGVEEVEGGIRFFYKKELIATNVETVPHPGFMTDWQGPWAVLMTQARGESTIHETIFEDRFGYVSELQKLGSDIEFFQPKVANPHDIYQFNIENERDMIELKQAIRIKGPTPLHNGVLQVSDLRAGASLLIAASVAKGETVIKGASVIDRGYEDIDRKLRELGAKIKKI